MPALRRDRQQRLPLPPNLAATETEIENAFGRKIDCDAGAAQRVRAGVRRAGMHDTCGLPPRTREDRAASGVAGTRPDTLGYQPAPGPMVVIQENGNQAYAQ